MCPGIWLTGPLRTSLLALFPPKDRQSDDPSAHVNELTDSFLDRDLIRRGIDVIFVAVFVGRDDHDSRRQRVIDASEVDSFDLDVDQNGTVDFTFTSAFVPDPFFTVGFATIDVPFATSNGTVIESATLDGFPTSRRLSAGDTVSSDDVFSFGSFDQSNLVFSTPFDPLTGNFDGMTGFVGLRFCQRRRHAFWFCRGHR